MPTYIVLLGPPGAGKGTQAQNIAKVLDLPHISSGDIFRENIKNQTELGKKADGYLQRGELVPDRVTIEIIRKRLSQADCKQGALLDGFPRTPPQAEAFTKILKDFQGKVNAVPYIKVPEDVLVSRLAGRRTCRGCGHIYHVKFKPPQKKGICDIDGSELYQRDDDKEETVKNRIRVYLDLTMPLIEYYRDKELLLEVDGTKSIREVTEELLKTISVSLKE